MIKRDQIESILKINGVKPSSPDEEIRSVLMSARYGHDEVDAALMVLRENNRTKQTRVDGLHKVFRTDEVLNPEEISALLGIDVQINERVQVESKVNDLGKMQYVLVWLLSFLIAIGGILYFMYSQQVGIFHPTNGVEFRQ